MSNPPALPAPLGRPLAPPNLDPSGPISLRLDQSNPELDAFLARSIDYTNQRVSPEDFSRDLHRWFPILSKFNSASVDISIVLPKCLGPEAPFPSDHKSLPRSEPLPHPPPTTSNAPPVPPPLFLATPPPALPSVAPAAPPQTAPPKKKIEIPCFTPIQPLKPASASLNEFKPIETVPFPVSAQSLPKKVAPAKKSVVNVGKVKYFWKNGEAKPFAFKKMYCFYKKRSKEALLVEFVDLADKFFC